MYVDMVCIFIYVHINIHVQLACFGLDCYRFEFQSRTALDQLRAPSQASVGPSGALHGNRLWDMEVPQRRVHIACQLWALLGAVYIQQRPTLRAREAQLGVMPDPERPLFLSGSAEAGSPQTAQSLPNPSHHMHNPICIHSHRSGQVGLVWVAAVPEDSGLMKIQILIIEAHVAGACRCILHTATPVGASG